jgi:hypothetical protein
MQFFTRGQFGKEISQEIVDSMVMWTLAKNSCNNLRNLIMLLVLNFMLSNQIPNVSLNGFKRRVVTYHKILTWPWMDEPLVVLES